MYILGLDIGGTKCAAVSGEWNGTEIKILKKEVCKTYLTVSAYDMLDRIFDMAERVLEKTPDAIGISCGGPLDSKKGVIMSPPNLPEWDNVEIVKLTEKRFGAPARLQNDANACAVAEWKFGAGRGCSDIVFLTFGTGLGAGMILGGRLYEGSSGNAGEAGHIRLADDGPIGYGKKGSFEGFCSGGGIAQLARKMATEAQKRGKIPLYAQNGADNINAKTVAEAALKGDATALEVYGISGKYLGRGLSVIVDILDPERIIIGGIFSRSASLLWDAAEKELCAEALVHSQKNCRVVPAALGEEIGDYAALATATLIKE